MRRKKYEDEYDQQYADYVGDFDDYDSAFSEEAAAATHAQQIQQRNQKKKKRRKRNFAILIVLLLALMVGEFTILMKKWVSPPDLNSALSDGNLEDDIVPNNVEGRKPGCYTFLIAGKDKAAGLTDTVLVGMLDTENGTLRFVSIPRDTAVNISWAPKKINQYYPAAENRGEDGVEALITGVEKIVGYRVDSYAIFDVDVFVELVDTMGGVEFDVPMDMYYSDPSQELFIDLKAGEQKLTGEQAMQLVRFRSGYATADLGRVDVQRQFVSAALDQWLSVKNIFKAPAALKLLMQSSQSSLTSANYIWLAETALVCDRANIQTRTLPGEAMYIAGGSYYVLDAVGVAQTVNECCNPYEQGVAVSDLYIRVG